jgi:hypothetical protein
MGRKTKKEKILAKLHRQQQVLNQKINTLSPVAPVIIDRPLTPDKPTVSNSSWPNYAPIKMGLLKTVIFTLLAICAQLVLRYVVKI